MLVDDLRGLGHEVHARHDDNVGRGFGREPGQRERVARDVRDAMVDVRRHVVVGQNNRVALLLQLLDLFDQGLEDRDLDVGQNALEVRGGSGLDRCRDHLWLLDTYETDTRVPIR